jgi:hypothetical protein
MNRCDEDNAPDPSHVADELTEREVPNSDYTASIPPIPGTFDPREDWPESGPQPEDRPPF